MTSYRLFIQTIIAGFFLLGCNGRKAATGNFSLSIDGKKKDIKLHSKIKINIKNKRDLIIDSINVKIAGQHMIVVNDAVTLSGIKPGKQELSVTVFSGGKPETLKKNITILSHIKPKIYTYRIINEYPHDKEAYTQGLEFYNDTLYESTGQKGRSTLRKTDYKTGKVLSSVKLDNTYFGEGITILNNKIYMLTWQSGKGFVYKLKTLEPQDTFVYGKSKEGWGLCNDGKKTLQKRRHRKNMDPGSRNPRRRRLYTNRNQHFCLFQSQRAGICQRKDIC